MAGRVRVFIATSLDGFIAGDNDDLSWLPPPGDDDGGFGAFMKEVGAILMGRNTYEVAAGFEGPWPYGHTPVHVATHRPLSPKASTVRAVSGTIDAMLDEALALANGKDVYLDGGVMIRQGLDAGRIHELTVTLVPVLLGSGARLFSGATRHALERISVQSLGFGMVQLRYALRRS